MFHRSFFLRSAALLLGPAFFTGAFAQSTDSLWKVWNNKSVADTVRMKTLGAMAWANMFSDADSALSLAMLLYDEAAAKQNRKYQVLALNHEGVAYSVLGNYYAAHVSYEQMLEMGEAMHDRKTIAGAHINLGVIFQEQGDNRRAMDHYARSVEVFEALGDKRSLATVYNNIGGIYQEQGDTAQAFAYMRKSMDIHRESDNRRAYASAIGNMGLVYMEQGAMAKASALFEESLAIKKEIGDKSGMAKSFHDIGELHRRQGHPDSAMVSFQRSRELRKELGDEQGLASSYVSMGFLRIDMGEHADAVKWCTDGLRTARDLGLLSQERNACDCLYKANKALGREAEALVHFERYTALGDSLRTDEVEKQLKQLEFKRLLLADSLTAVEADLRKQLEAEKRSSTARRTVLWGGGVAVPIIVIAVAMRKRRARRQQG
ncbi:MAG: tetratricopeptide repeat protein [Flavobacteriales bacterium]